jgi:hypothetical protein
LTGAKATRPFLSVRSESRAQLAPTKRRSLVPIHIAPALTRISTEWRHGKAKTQAHSQNHTPATGLGALQNRSSQQPDVHEFSAVVRPRHSGIHRLVLFRAEARLQQDCCDPLPNVLRAGTLCRLDNQPAISSGPSTRVRGVRCRSPQS